MDLSSFFRRKPRPEPKSSPERSKALAEGAALHRKGQDLLRAGQHIQAAGLFLRAGHVFAKQEHDGGVREALYRAEEAFHGLEESRKKGSGVSAGDVEIQRNLLQTALKAAESDCLGYDDRKEYRDAFALRLNLFEQRFGKK